LSLPHVPESSEAEIAAALVARIRQGEAEAEGLLVERYQRGILYQLHRMSRDHALCEDLSQDTLCLVLQKIRAGEVREPQKLAGFIRNTASNVFIADYRKKSRRGEHGDPVPASDLASGANDPQTQTERKQLAALVHRVIDQMSAERDRLILFRFYVLQEDRDSVCDFLQIDRELFNRVLHRARRRFKELWQARVARGTAPQFLGVVLFLVTLCHYLIRATATR